MIAYVYLTLSKTVLTIFKDVFGSKSILKRPNYLCSSGIYYLFESVPRTFAIAIAFS